MTRILQITDPHIMPDGQLFQGRVDTAAALRAMLGGIDGLLPRIAPVRRIVVTGDLTETGCAAACARFRDIMAQCPLPWRAIPGNHDRRAPMRAALTDAVWMPTAGPINWREDLNGLTLLGLDTLVEGAAHGAVTEDALGWLQAALRDLVGRPVMLFLHHPPIATGITAMDDIGLRDPGPLAQVLAAYPGPLQIGCGHIHRMIVGNFAGRQVIIAPASSHAVSLDQRPQAPLCHAPGDVGAVLHHFEGGFRAALISVRDFTPGQPFA